MSLTTLSDKSRIYVNDDFANGYYVNIQNRYTHDGNGNVTEINVFSQTFSKRNELVEIGSFKDGNFVLNNTGSEFFSGNIEQFQNESQKISEKPSTLRSLGLTTEKQKNDFAEKSGVVNKEQIEVSGFSDEDEDDDEDNDVTISEDDINENLKNRQFIYNP